MVELISDLFVKCLHSVPIQQLKELLDQDLLIRDLTDFSLIRCEVDCKSHQSYQSEPPTAKRNHRSDPIEHRRRGSPHPAKDRNKSSK
jgi:hypothetical protein